MCVCVCVCVCEGVLTARRTQHTSVHAFEIENSIDGTEINWVNVFSVDTYKQKKKIQDIYLKQRFLIQI